MMKLFLNGSQIIKNIGMVKFEVIQDCCFRMIMNELGAFIEESRIIFVCLDYKVLAPAQPCALAKPKGYTAN